MHLRLVGERHGQTHFPQMKGTPHVTAAPQKRLSATVVLAGVTGGPRHSPGPASQPSGPPACAFLPPPLRSLRGHPAGEGPGEPRVPGSLLCPPLSPWKWGFPAKALASIAWTVGVRPCLSGESRSEVRFKVLERSKTPLGTPSLTCPSLHAFSGRGQWMMEPGKGEPPGTRPPHSGGVRDPCTVSCRSGP